jgi:anti-anti-sigma regulatory factor
MSGRDGGPSEISADDASAISVFKQGIDSYNAKNSTSLVFVSIESATKQVVSGFNFKGVINVTDGGAAAKYQVTVWEKAGGKSIEVTEFTKL